MTTIYSAPTTDVTINSNVVTLHKVSMDHVQLLCAYREIDQLSLTRSGGTVSNPLYDMSYAMRSLEHEMYAGLIHREKCKQAAEILKKNPHLDPKGPGPKGTPPTGGTPGAARVTKFENTVAIAA